MGDEYAGFEKHTRGFGSRMLEKMGFKQGSGLGRHSDGIQEPLKLSGWGLKQGLCSGASASHAHPSTTSDPCAPAKRARHTPSITDFDSLRSTPEMRVSNLRAVVFDMGCLIQDSELLNCAAWDRCLVKMLGISEEVVTEYPAYTLLPEGLSDKDMLLHLLAAHNVPFHWSRIEEMLEAKDEEYKGLRKGLRLREGVRKLLSELQDRGWRTGVVQKGSRRRLNYELDQLGIKQQFIVQVSLGGLSDEQQQRPYTDMYTECRLRMQVDNYTTAVCESSPIVLHNLHTTGLVPIKVPSAESHDFLIDVDAIETKLNGTLTECMCLLIELKTDKAASPAPFQGTIHVGKSVLVESLSEHLWYKATVMQVDREQRVAIIELSDTNRTRHTVAIDLLYALCTSTDYQM